MSTETKTRRIVTQKEAAPYLKVSEAMLEQNRWRGGDIPFFKVGGSVRYDLDVLDDYMDSQMKVKAVEL